VTGAVNSWAGHDAVMAAAWDAPGVKSVSDHLVVD
jgi:osmotically-inducible protein OsmY